jgi:hypothetical protein
MAPPGAVPFCSSCHGGTSHSSDCVVCRFFIVKAIYCQNRHLDQNGEERLCGRLLVILTDAQVHALCNSSENVMPLRCPSCTRDLRWSEVAAVNGELVWRPTHKPNIGEIKSLSFDKVTTIRQVA